MGGSTPRADPAFHTKAQAVCHLYLDPPADTVLLRVDEKTCMQARSRKRATRPVRPGQPERREFEYRRHGTVSLMAALNVTTGTIHPKIIKKNDSDTFIEFLTELAETADQAKKIHLILDNGSSHTSKQTRKWLSEHPRITVTYTPTHASWLNMVEIFFSILTRRMLRRGDFSLPRRPDPEDHQVHQDLQPHRQTLPLDLRRQAPPSRMNPRRTYAVLH